VVVISVIGGSKKNLDSEILKTITVGPCYGPRGISGISNKTIKARL
jgi:hypothetical protein